MRHIPSLEDRGLFGKIFRMFFPTAQHRHKVVPPVQDNHDEMSRDESKKSAHGAEMPDSGIVKPTHQPAQPGKLHRIEHYQAAQQGNGAEKDSGGVSEFLQGIVLLSLRRLLAEQEVVLDHRPHPGNVTRHEQHRLVVPGKDLVSDIDDAGCDEDPHEGEMPLLRACQPSSKRENVEPTADGQRMEPLWNHEQVFLRDLRAKAGKGKKDLNSAPDQNGYGDCADPVGVAHDCRLLKGGHDLLASFTGEPCDPGYRNARHHIFLIQSP